MDVILIELIKFDIIVFIVKYGCMFISDDSDNNNSTS